MAFLSKKAKSKIWKLFKISIYFFLIISVITAGFIIGVVNTFSKQLPEIDYYKYKPSINTKIFDVNNNIIREFHQDENRTARVPFKKIPKHMEHAIISIEDARFYNHYGIDPIRIAGTFLKNFRKGRITGGASTLTMQLARNAFLTLDQTWTRKIKEIIMSFKIEKKFTKQEILEMYLNEIYYGHRAYGLASAAKVYFGKKAEELNLAECSTLAGIINQPHRLDLYRNPNLARKRQKLVLKMMVRHNYISPEESDEAARAPLPLSNGNIIDLKSSYFVEHVRKFLYTKFTTKQIYTQGLKIYTTLDPKLQRDAENAFANAEFFKDNPLEKNPLIQGGLVAIDPTNGHIKAMVGGRDYKTSNFNRVTMAIRQPGSSFKPFVYLTALKNGVKANEILIDEPLEIVDKYTKAVWKPQNYGNRYNGPLTLKECLMKSLNSIAVKLIQKVGPKKVIETAHAMGIESKIKPYLSIALGAVDVTLLEMATAYTTIASGGIKFEPVAVTKIVNSNNNVIYEADYSGKRVMDEEHIYLLTDLMQAVLKSGTGTRARIDRPCAGKTGTTNDYRSAWFCGFTPNLVACLYVGHDQNKSLGARMSAGRISAPIWKLFMEEAVKDIPIRDFRKPENVIIKTVCKESGLLQGDRCTVFIDIPFIKNTEPNEICNSHIEENDNHEIIDGTMIITPKRMVVTDTLSEFETKEEDLDLDLEAPEPDDIITINRLEKTKTRSRFQNSHSIFDND